MRLRWCATDPADPAVLEHWSSLLDDGERARAERFRFASDRHAFVAAHALVRTMLSEIAGAPASSWRFVAGAHGKPELAPAFAELGLHFNLSHTRGWAACAVARTPLGVDVEAIDRGAALDVIETFAPSEARLLRACSADELPLAFTRLWTLKEAFVKATGEGLQRPLDSFAFTLDPVRIAFHGGADDPAAWQFHELAPAPGHRLALALRRSP